MKIHCPNCGYTREMADERIPTGVVTARCPQCGQTFRFSRDMEEAGQVQENRPAAVRLSSLPKKDASKPDAQPQARDGQGKLTQEFGCAGGPARSRSTEQERADDLPPGAVVHEQEENLFARPLARKEKEEGASQQTGETGQTESARDSGAARASVENREERGARNRETRQTEDVHTEDEEGWSFNPWECARTLQEFVPALYQTCLRVMFAPQRFFAGIVPRSALLALAFFFTICVLQTVIEHVWSIAFFHYIMPTTTDPEIRQLGELISGKGNFFFWLVLRCVMLCLQLYIYTAILYLCWRLLARARVDFSVVLQVLCYAQAPLILCIIPGVGTIAGMIWSFVCALVGCKAALRLGWGQTVLGAAPLCLLILFSYMQFMSLL